MHAREAGRQWVADPPVAVGRWGNNVNVVVVGSGIAGMVAALRLHEAGVDVRVLEAAAEPGGRMGTHREQGYVIDRAASVFPGGYEQMVRLVADLGLGADVRPSSDLVGIVRDGETVRMHTSSRMDTARSRSLSWGAKARMPRVLLDERKIARSLDWEDGSAAAAWDTETAARYAERRLTPELLERLIEPAIAALSLASPEEVSVVDFFYGLHFLLAGGFFNFAGGSDRVIREIADRVPVTCGASVRTVVEGSGAVRVEWTNSTGDHVDEADACVVTGAAPQILAVHPELDEPAREVLDALDYTVSVGVHLGLASPPSEDAMLIQVPRCEHPDLASVTLDHLKGPGRTPEGRGLVTTNWRHGWGVDVFELDDDSVIERALPAIEQVLPGVGSEVEVTHVERWRHAIAISAPGRYEALRTLRRHLDPTSRVQLAGDFHTICSTNGSLCAGEAAARRILSHGGG